MYLNIGCDHYFICPEHRVYWYFGSNLFSQWKEEAEAKWEANRRMLDGWTCVEPARTRLEVCFPRLARCWYRLRYWWYCWQARWRSVWRAIRRPVEEDISF